MYVQFIQILCTRFAASINPGRIVEKRDTNQAKRLNLKVIKQYIYTKNYALIARTKESIKQYGNKHWVSTFNMF